MNEISTDVRVIIDPETMNVTSGGDVTGLLYLRFRDTFFPREGWLDFPELVLHAWLSSLLVILFQVDNVAMFRFLEGPPVLWGRVLGGGGLPCRVCTARKEEERTASSCESVILRERFSLPPTRS